MKVSTIALLAWLGFVFPLHGEYTAACSSSDLQFYLDNYGVPGNGCSIGDVWFEDFGFLGDIAASDVSVSPGSSGPDFTLTNSNANIWIRYLATVTPSPVENLDTYTGRSVSGGLFGQVSVNIDLCVGGRFDDTGACGWTPAGPISGGGAFFLGSYSVADTIDFNLNPQVGVLTHLTHTNFFIAGTVIQNGFTTAPEPGAWLLTAFGLLAVVGLRIRRGRVEGKA